MIYEKDSLKTLPKEKFNFGEIFPPKNGPCLCRSGKRYKNCCEKEERRPFVPLEKGIKILPDKNLFFIDDLKDQKLLLRCIAEINHFRTNRTIRSLSLLSKKYLQNRSLPFLLALAYKFNHNLQTFQSLIKSFKQEEEQFLPMKLLRLWHVYEWGLMPDVFGNQNIIDIYRLAPGRDSFFVTEFFLWGLIRIQEALYSGRILEAESHFLSLNKVAEKMSAKKHWALEEGASILEAGYFTRRVRILEQGC